MYVEVGNVTVIILLKVALYMELTRLFKLWVNCGGISEDFHWCMLSVVYPKAKYLWFCYELYQFFRTCLCVFMYIGYQNGVLRKVLDNTLKHSTHRTLHAHN